MQTFSSSARKFLFAELAKKWDPYPKWLLFTIKYTLLRAKERRLSFVNQILVSFFKIDKEDQAVLEK